MTSSVTHCMYWLPPLFHHRVVAHQDIDDTKNKTATLNQYLKVYIMFIVLPVQWRLNVFINANYYINWGQRGIQASLVSIYRSDRTCTYPRSNIRRSLSLSLSPIINYATPPQPPPPSLTNFAPLRWLSPSLVEAPDMRNALSRFSIHRLAAASGAIYPAVSLGACNPQLKWESNPHFPSSHPLAPSHMWRIQFWKGEELLALSSFITIVNWTRTGKGILLKNFYDQWGTPHRPAPFELAC